MLGFPLSPSGDWVYGRDWLDAQQSHLFFGSWEDQISLLPLQLIGTMGLGVANERWVSL